MFRINQTATLTEKLSAMFSLPNHQLIPVVQTASPHAPHSSNALELSAAGRRRRRRLSKFGAAPNNVKSTWF